MRLVLGAKGEGLVIHVVARRDKTHVGPSVEQRRRDLRPLSNPQKVAIRDLFHDGGVVTTSSRSRDGKRFTGGGMLRGRNISLATVLQLARRGHLRRDERCSACIEYAAIDNVRRLYPFVANTVWRLTESGWGLALGAAARAGVTQIHGGGDGIHVLVVHRDPTLLRIISDFLHEEADARVSVVSRPRHEWFEQLSDVQVALVEGTSRLVTALEHVGVRCVRLVSRPAQHAGELGMPFSSEELLRALQPNSVAAE